MTDTRPRRNPGKGAGQVRERGVATVELAIMLPLLLIILFAIVDIGRLLDARFTVTKLAQQGGLLVFRDLPTPVTPVASPDLIILLQNASTLNLVNSGRIYVWQIIGATTSGGTPTIDTNHSGLAAGYGALAVNSSIGAGYTKLGLTNDLYAALGYDSALGMAPIPQVTVVEIFYQYQPITPLSRLMPGLLTGSGGGFIISSKAIFP